MRFLRLGAPGLLVALLFALPALIPRDAVVLEVAGKDTWRTHRSFFGRHVVAQSFSAPARRIHGIALFLAPYVKQKPPRGQVKLTLHDAGGKLLREAAVEAREIREGRLVRFYFAPLILREGERLELRLSAPELDARNAVAVRFDPDPDAVTPGAMYWRGRPYGGDLALQVLVPSNYYGELWAVWKRKASWRELSLLSLLAASLLAAWLLIWRRLSPRARRAMVWASLIALLVLVFCLRVELLPRVRGVSGGDAYNYLFILQRLRQLENPYLHAKRLPGFPLILLPASYLTRDIISAARWLNQAAAALILLLLVVLGRQLGFSWFAVWLAALLAAGARPLLFTPYRPLAYPWLALAVLLTLVILFGGRSFGVWRAAAASVVMGWGMQTRHEAFLVFAVLSLGILALAVLKRRGALLAAWLLPALLLSLPFFWHNWAVYGNPFYSPYFDHPVTNVRLSWQEWEERVLAGWGVLSSLWWRRWAHQWRLPAWLVLSVLSAAVLLLAGRGAAGFWRRRAGGRRDILWRRGSEVLLWGRGFGLASAAGLIFYYSAYHEEEWLRWAAGAWWALALAGGLLVFWDGLRFFGVPRSLSFPRAWRLLLTLAVALALWFVPTWAHPALKSYVALLPLAALGAGFAAAQLGDPRQGKGALLFARAWSGLASVLLLALLLQAPLATAKALPSAIERASLRHVKEELLYQAGLALGEEEGKVAAKHRYLALQYFLPRRVEEYPERDAPPSLAELEKRGAQFLLWTSWDNLFRPYLTLPGGVELWREWRGEDDRGREHVVRVLRLRSASIRAGAGS